MGSDVKGIEGFVARGGETPFVDAKSLIIVGVDESLTDENWWAFCPRADEPLDDAFVADIAANGVIQPIETCRDGSRLIVLDGRRRVKAARLATNPSVRVIIRRDKPENLFRYNVGAEATRKALRPTQRAALMQHYMKHGATEEDCARVFGCGPKTVQNALALLDLAVPVQKAVDEGLLPSSEAKKLSSLPRDKQKEALSELIAAGATKGQAASTAIEQVKRGEKVEVEKNDRGTRMKMRSRDFLEKLLTTMKKRMDDEERLVDGVEFLRFILGGALPSDTALCEFIEQSGLKAPKPKSEKKPKSPKEKKPTKAKETKAA